MIGNLSIKGCPQYVAYRIARMEWHVRPAMSVAIVLVLICLPASAQAILKFVEVQKDSVGGVDGLAGASSVTVSPDGNYLYTAGTLDHEGAVFSIDLPSEVVPWIPLLLLDD